MHWTEEPAAVGKQTHLLYGARARTVHPRALGWGSAPSQLAPWTLQRVLRHPE